jgi:hypothetical protein
MKLAIKGHSKRRKEVLKLLQSLGGKEKPNINYSYCYEDNLYYINKDGYIDYVSVLNPLAKPTWKIYTLEEFEAKYPYKVVEKVLYLNGRKEWVEGIIDKMVWNENKDTLTYYVNNIDGTSAGPSTTMFLKPMKQKELKDYLKPGYVVEYDDGDRCVLTQDVHGNVFGIGIGKTTSWDSLFYPEGIVAVYQINKPTNLHRVDVRSSIVTKVWEKPKEVELTMQQIADKFGIDVNQLKIKK